LAEAILHIFDCANVTLKVCTLYALYLPESLTPCQIGHITLDNAENNATAMQELQSLLSKRETATSINFDPLNHHVRCYAHIINICSLHIVASMTSTSKSYLSRLKVPVGSSVATRSKPNNRADNSNSDEGSDDNSDLDDDPNLDDLDDDTDQLNLPGCFDDQWDPMHQCLFSGIKRDPLKHARKLVTFLRALGPRKTGLRNIIKEGNKAKWFIGKDIEGKHLVVQVPQLELLRDVKTRWDLVYLMLERLQQLRPVGLFRDRILELN